MDMMDDRAKVKDEVVYPSEGSDSVKYKGVRKRKWGKWVSEIRVPHCRDRIWLGSYDTAEKAARAFDAALYCLRGSHANFNFPSTPSEIDVPTHQSFTPEEIQEIAAAFANGHQTSQQGMENLESSRAMLEENIDSTFNMVSEENHIQPLSLGSEIMPEFDHNEFSNPLHLNEDGSSHQSFFLGLEKMHSDDLLLYPQLLIPGEDNVDDIHGGDHEAFSTPSFLWNF